MKRAIIVSLAVVALAACDNRPLDQQEYSKTSMTNIPELADCVYIRVSDVRILRCPKSDTSVTYTVPQGKQRKTVTTTVISGEDK